MGKIKYLLIGFLIFIITSCDGLLGNNIGKPIKFGIAQYPITRTAYSPYYDGRIDWIEGDKVTIYMDWDVNRDGSGYSNNYRESGVYEVYNIHPNDRESHGSIRYISGEQLKWKGDFSGNDGRAHEYPHTFWSVYPSNTFFADGKFEFSLPSNQDNINDVTGLGLAAYEKDVYSNTDGEGHVELHYYPMFTTLCVTIDNAANFQIGNSLELLSDDYMIAGKYSVDISKRYNDIEGGDINNVSSTFSNSEIMLFIIPREYEANKLYFSLNGERKLIPEVLHAGYKYNIKITTKEVKVEGVPDAVAQMILFFLRTKDGNSCYSLFEKFFKQYYGYDDANSFNNSKDFNGQSWWNNFLNKHWVDANNTGKWGDALTNLFSENTIKEGALQAFLNELQSIIELDLNDGSSKLTCNFDDTTNLSKYFPNLQTLKLYIDGQKDYKIYLTGFSNLSNVEIGGNNSEIIVYISKGSNINITAINNNKITVIEI